jgi:hypothetical protein
MRFLFVVASITLLTGCAGLKKFLNPYGPPKACGEGGYCSTADLLRRGEGSMTFEDSIQMFGPPSNCADAGQTKACRWSYDSGGMVMSTFGNVAVAQPIGGRNAQLTFISDKLKAWQLQGDWK